MDDPIDNAAFAHPGMVRDLVRLLPRRLTEDLDLRTLRRLPSANVGKGATPSGHAAESRLPPLGGPSAAGASAADA